MQKICRFGLRAILDLGPLYQSTDELQVGALVTVLTATHSLQSAACLDRDDLRPRSLSASTSQTSAWPSSSFPPPTAAVASPPPKTCLFVLYPVVALPSLAALSADRRHWFVAGQRQEEWASWAWEESVAWGVRSLK